MRTRLLVALCTAPLLAPLSSARAQESDPPDETEGMDVVDAPDMPPTRDAQVPNVPGAVTTAPGQVHTVTNGDTLWDLSQQYLGSPWYWPKVWSYNPEIANPHWIYPGNRVRFFPSNGEELPQQVAPAPVAAQQPSGEDETQLDALPSDLVTVSGPIGYQGAPTFPVSSEGFVTREELEGSGVIEGAKTDALMLSYSDVVYVRFKRRDDARVGDRYQIFRPGRAIHEPVSGRFVGHLTHILGELVVVDLAAELVPARVEGTVDEVRRGDRVGPAGEVSLARVRPSAQPGGAQGSHRRRHGAGDEPRRVPQGHPGQGRPGRHRGRQHCDRGAQRGPHGSLLQSRRRQRQAATRTRTSAPAWCSRSGSRRRCASSPGASARSSPAIATSSAPRRPPRSAQ